MTTNQKSQNAWVQDLNKSVNDIQRKERNNKFLRYFGLLTGCIIIFGIVFVLGKTKLQVVNPKLELTVINDTQVIEPKVIKPELKEPVSKPIQLSKVKDYLESHLEINHPKKSLNEDKNVKASSLTKKNGKYITYYDNGNKWVELYFENGLREGVQFTWHRNGKLKSELNYVSGKKHGLQKWWEKNGKILNEKNYIHGEWQKK